MPFKFYHGRTGRVFNVAKRSLGVEVTKQVRNRVINKRIHVRVEHVIPSRCREDFLKRIEENKAIRRTARDEKRKIQVGED
jgi:large subunit ribosomal protein L21e